MKDGAQFPQEKGQAAVIHTSTIAIDASKSRKQNLSRI